MSKNVLITGGNSGIGLATARLFKEKGYSVVISGRDTERVRLAAAELGAVPLIADMTDLDAVQNLAGFFRDTGLDVLVNNAAMADFMPLGDITAAHFSTFFNTNVRGPLILIKELVPALEKRRGAVVNVSSVITSKGIANCSLYAATKGALEAATRSLSLELMANKIRINIVAPGAVDTPIIGKTGLSEQQIQELRRRQTNNIPMGRYGSPEEIAHVILAQAESTYVTGSVWRVDGGVDA